MKALYKFLFILLPFVLSAENPIPNAGFEDWNNGEPTGWFTNNLPTVLTPITQSGTAHTGSSALKIESLDISGNPYPASVTAGTVLDSDIPVSQNFEKLTGYYQLQTTGSEELLVLASLYDANKVLVATIFEALEEVTDQYKSFSFDFDYSFGNGNDAAFMNLQFTLFPSSLDSIQIGAYFLIDDLEMSGVTAITPANELVPNKFELRQNYPNPFNPSTTIDFSIPKSQNVRLDVYNLLGARIASIVNERLDAGNYSVKWNASGSPGGTYFYRLVTSENAQVRKLVLLK